MKKHMIAMQKRVKNGLEPLTGEKMETMGMIAFRNGVLSDETGKPVELNARGTWVYKK